MTGVVRTFNQRGFGFIETDKFPSGLYFHISAVLGRPHDVPEDAAVTFELGENSRGPCAVSIELQEG
jgi:cold shock CspA family protein